MNKKVAIVWTLIVIFVFLILGFILFFHYQTIYTNQKNLTNLTNSRMEYANKRLLWSQEKVEDNASTLLVDNDILSIKNSERMNDDYAYLLSIEKIRTKLKERVLNTDEIDNISVYSPTQNILISTSNSTLGIREEIIKPISHFEWRLTKKGLYFFMTNQFDTNKPKIVVAIQLSDSSLSDVQDLLSSSDDEGALLLPDGQILGLSPVVRDFIDKNQNEILQKNDYQPFRLSGIDRQALKLTNPSSNITLLTLMSVRKYDSVYFKATLITMLMILVVLGLGITLILLYYRNVLSEISLLSYKLKKVEEGNYDERIERRHNNEFDYLFEQFNLMTTSIQKLFKTLIQEIKLREIAEEKQFQAQIQPHFLYNSLFYIISVVHNPEAVIDMIRHLAEYYRYLSKEAGIVYLEDEIEFARNYLTIQSLRKGFYFEIINKADKGKIKILPLLIQPIIENAIQHGIEEKEKADLIKVIVNQKNNLIKISVIDNGPGMSNIEIERLVQNINLSIRVQNSIGLWNMNQRLKNTYGKASQLKIFRNALGGLTVSFFVVLSKGGVDNEVMDY